MDHEITNTDTQTQQEPQILTEPPVSEGLPSSKDFSAGLDEVFQSQESEPESEVTFTSEEKIEPETKNLADPWDAIQSLTTQVQTLATALAEAKQVQTPAKTPEPVDPFVAAAKVVVGENAPAHVLHKAAQDLKQKAYWSQYLDSDQAELAQQQIDNIEANFNSYSKESDIYAQLESLKSELNDLKNKPVQEKELESRTNNLKKYMSQPNVIKEMKTDLPYLANALENKFVNLDSVIETLKPQLGGSAQEITDVINRQLQMLNASFKDIEFAPRKTESAPKTPKDPGAVVPSNKPRNDSAVIPQNRFLSSREFSQGLEGYIAKNLN